MERDRQKRNKSSQLDPYWRTRALESRVYPADLGGRRWNKQKEEVVPKHSHHPIMSPIGALGDEPPREESGTFRQLHPGLYAFAQTLQRPFTESLIYLSTRSSWILGNMSSALRNACF